MGTTESHLKRLMSGQARGPAASLARAALSLCEPCYAAALTARNALFDRGLRKSAKLPRPTISVGNITTGGTGKTPTVRWLAEQLQQRTLRPAVLMRGYKAHGGASDEQLMLRSMLPGVAVEAGPDRAESAKRALTETTVDCFILDDAFQHRQVARNFDLVLISATDPFGYNHVLPRGLLREPLRGLARASAFLITRANLADGSRLDEIQRNLKKWNPSAPIFRANHHLSQLRDADSRPIDIAELTRRPFFAVAGIGNPEALDTQLRESGAVYLGGEWLADHAVYTDEKVQQLKRAAEALGARAIVTTEKDWVKLSPLPSAREGLPIWRLDVLLVFSQNDSDQLVSLLMNAIRPV